MNIFSHFLPALYFTWHAIAAVCSFGIYSELQQWQSTGFVTFLGLACAFDMWSSVIYHLYFTMGNDFMIKLLTFDLVGIVGVTLASFTSIGFVIFDEWSQERNILFAVMIPLIISNFFALLLPMC